MKKKIISLLSALALTAQIVPCALADNDVKVYVNDTEMVTDAPIIIETTTHLYLYGQSWNILTTM